MKRFIALLLVVVIAATTLNITALAYNDYDEGYYQGKYYYARLNTYGGTDATGYMSWRGNGSVTCRVAIHSTRADNGDIDQHYAIKSKPSPEQSVSVSVSTPNYHYLIDWVTADCKANNKRVVELSAWS